MADSLDTTVAKREKWGKWFRPAFYAAGYKSQHDFAKAANVSRVQVQRWLAGTARPNPESMPAIIDALYNTVSPREAYSAASYNFPEPQPEIDPSNFQAIFDSLDDEDQHTLHLLAVRLQSEKSRRVRLSSQLKTESSATPLHFEEALSNKRLLAIDVDDGTLYAPDGTSIHENQIQQVGELIGRLSALYSRSGYTQIDITPVLADVREHFRLPDQSIQIPEETINLIST